MDHKTLKPDLFFVSALLLVLCLTSSNAQSNCNSYRFTNNNAYTNCAPLSALNAFLHWTHDSATNNVRIAFRTRVTSSSSTWVAWGLNPSGQQMLGTQAIVAVANSTGQFRAYTSPVTGLDTQLQSGRLSFDVSGISASFVGGEVVIFATLGLPASMISTNQVWQVGPVSSSGVPQAHPMSGDNMRSVGSIDFRSGQAGGGGAGGMGSRQRKRNRHGVLNAVSWGILMPMGAIMARYVKVFADPAWFYLHIACQVSGYVVGVAGWATGIKLGDDSPGTSYSKHRNIGITLFVFGTLQVFALLLRPKKDHKYRLYWNIYHHAIGYSTIILSIINVFEGFDILDPSDKWRWIYIGILIFLGAVAAILEAVTWAVVLKRKSRGDTRPSNKHPHSSNGINGVNGVTSTQHVV